MSLIRGTTYKNSIFCNTPFPREGVRFQNVLLEEVSDVDRACQFPRFMGRKEDELCCSHSECQFHEHASRVVGWAG